MNDKLKEIEEYAKSERVPIMLPSGIDYLCNYIKNNGIKRVLEIGSAIGYSAIRMALVDDEVMITTIEKDEQRYKMAVKNISLFGLDERIKIINGDALESLIDGKFDLLFIDASKGNNINFFNKYKDNLVENGVIITDNLLFHGLVQNESLAVTRNQRGLVKKIKNFKEFLDNNQEFVTEYVRVGDGISISRRRMVNEDNC